jgi:hypothetical protein
MAGTGLLIGTLDTKGDELAFLRDRESDVVDDGAPFPARPGQAIWIPKGAFRSTVNTGWEPTVLLAIHAPAGAAQALKTLPDYHRTAPVRSWVRLPVAAAATKTSSWAGFRAVARRFGRQRTPTSNGSPVRARFQRFGRWEGAKRREIPVSEAACDVLLPKREQNVQQTVDFAKISTFAPPDDAPGTVPVARPHRRHERGLRPATDAVAQVRDEAGAGH